MTYFKFKSNNEVWVVPVYIDSVMYRNPEKCYSWLKDIQFLGEVTKAEYDAQFEPVTQCVQLEFDFS